MKAAVFVLLALAAASSAYKVKVSPTTETIGEGFRQLITFELDEPIICPVQADKECAVVIKLTNSHPDQVTLDNCHVKWIAGQWQTKRFVWARAVEDFVDDKEMTFTIKTEPIESSSAYYNGFDPEDIVLTTKPRPSAVCSATGDPHYTTFDKHYYHIYAPGRVVFYKSTNPNHNFEVQTDMYSFHRPAVHCGIAVREDNDVVVISLCGDGHNINYRRTCGSSSCRSNGYPKVSITSGNNPNYIINFASGAQVRAQVAYWSAIGKRYMNVYATAPGQDWKQTAGVCGNNDQVATNDVNVGHNGWIRDLANLYESQRPTENLFSWHPAPGSEPPAPTLPPFAEECDYIPPAFVRPILNHPDAEDITDLIKQSLPDNEEDAEGINFDDFELGDLPERMPMEDARAMCERIRATQVAMACLEVFPDFDMDGFIEGCADDLSETGGDPEFLTVAVDALENECADNGNRNLDTWETDNDGKPIEPSKELQDAMCPNACSDHGECKATRCECEEPWSGIDCSINKGQAPITENVVRGSCDGRHINPCPVEVSVIGRNFWNSDKLACRFGGAEGTVTRAYYLGSIEVACEVPARQHKGRSEERASIEVTTDGENWSTIKDEVAFLWYDSVCQICTAEGCEPNPESCFIDGECYFATQPEDDNVCLRCEPEQSTSAWSYTDGHHTECGPEFPVEHYGARIIAEGTAGETVLTVTAANPLTAGDAEGGAKVTYAIQTSRDDLLFQIDAQTGAISLKEDLEITPATHVTWQGTFLVVATDGHGRTDTTTVHVEALSGGTVPIFAQESYTLTVAENTAPATVLGAVKAVDGDSGEDGEITYRWLQEVQYRAGAFLLDAATGEVRVGEDSPDFEDLAEYNLIVMATDGAGMYSTVSVKIVVTNVNEAPKDIVLAPASVPENTAAGTVVGSLSAVDDDVDDTFTFRLLGGDTDKLELRDGKDVVLKVVPDFEAQPEYTLQVAATDAGGLSTQRAVKVAITNVNEPPKNIVLETTRFSENARGVLSLLTVEDDDEGDFVACTLTGTDDGHFELLGGSQQRLVLKTPLDYETAKQHVITVVCEDSAGATASRQFTLTIDDAKEAPERLALAQAAPLPEDAPAGTLVGTVSAIDADAGAGNLEFAIDGEGADDFEFVGQADCAVVSGAMTCSQRLQVKAGASLDYDAAPTATVMVRVLDSQDRDLALLDEIEVALSNVNEPPRGLRWVAGTGKVQENAPAGTLVGQLLVDDEDSDDSFTFALSAGAQGIFKLVTGDSRRRRAAGAGARAVSVVVEDGSRIDFESTGGSLPLTLTVTDEGGNTVALTTTVTVEDEPLSVVFRDTETHFAFVSEDVDVGTLVGRLEVKGLDTEGAEPAFGMAEGAAAAVPVMEVRRNGMVRTTQELDFDTRGAYLLEVTVTFADDVLPSFTDKLTVTLTDVDEPPFFVDAPSTLNVKQDAGRGSTVATLVAKDPEGEHVTLALTAAPEGLVELTSENTLRLLAMPSSADFAVGAYTVEVTASSASEGDDDTVLTLTINLVDDCFEDPCSGNGDCTDVGIGAFSCACYSGWAGEVCDQEGVAFGSQGSDAAAGTGMIAGIAVGMLILIVAVALVVVVVMRRRRERQVDKDLLAWSREAEEGGVFDNPTFIAPKGEEAMYAAVGAGGADDFVPGVSNPMYGWYRPEMTRQDATEELLSCPEGAFVVRDSKATPGWHMLGVKTPDAVVHEKIRLSEDGLYELLPSSGRPQPMFENVPSLVQYYGSAPRADVGYVLAVSSFDNPMYALGAGAEAGHYHTTWRRDAEAPAVPLKERELNDVAIVAAAQDDIYTNTAEAAAALRRPSTTNA